jgi:hypothetical protein
MRHTLALFGFLTLCAAPAARADITLEEPQEVVRFSQVTVAAKQAELGNDVGALFAFVRDRIRHDVYRGVLRGGNGTLLAEAGNALDKTVLLRELLAFAGHETRFAHGPLFDSARAGLLLTPAPLPQPLSSVDSSTDVDPTAKALLDKVQRDTDDHFRTVKAAIAGANISLPKTATVTPEDLLTELGDHYWLQVKQGNGWIDLDPSFADAQPGKSYAALAETLPALPDELFHRVSLQIILEEMKDQQLTTRPLLTYEATAASLSAMPLVLAHQPGSWTKPTPISELGAAMGAVTARITTIFSALDPPKPAGPENRIKPIFILSSQYFPGEAFDLTHPDNEAGGRAPTDIATGEWIAIELRAPGATATKTERWIFDRIGFAARKAGRHDVASGPLGFAHPLAGMYCISVSTGPLMSNLLIPDASEQPKTVTVPSSESQVATQLGTLLASLNGTMALSSDRLTSPMRLGDQEASFIVASPRVIISAYRSNASAATLSLDLRHTVYVPRAYSEALHGKDFQLNVIKGILDGVLETEMVGLLLTGADAEGVKTGSHSTSEIFKIAAEAGIDPIALTESGAPVPSSFPPEAAARISADLGAGNIVIAPEQSVDVDGKKRVAWWRIDPTTGQTTGVTEDGLHQEATEYIILENKTTGEFMGIRVLGTEGPKQFTVRSNSHLNEYLQYFRSEGWRANYFNPFN